MARRSKRPNLAEFVTARLDGPLRAAVASGGGDEAICQRGFSDVLQVPGRRAPGQGRRAAGASRSPMQTTCRTSSTAAEEAGRPTAAGTV